MTGVSIVNTDAAAGYAPRAAYDRIVSTAAVWDIPPAWTRQLKPRGRMVVPLQVHAAQVSACLIPQPEVSYKLTTKGANLIARKDGIYLGGNGIVGNWDTTPSKEQTEKVVGILQKLMEEMRG